VVSFGTLGVIVTNATTNHYVDTKGFAKATILAIHHAAAATDSSAKWTSMVLGHSPTTDITNVTAIDGATGTTNATATSAQFVIPAHNLTAVPCIVEFHVDLTKKERYLHLLVQASAAAYSTASFVAILHRAESTPTTDALAGAAQVVWV